MTVRLSNIHQTWANTNHRYVGLGLNIDSTGYNEDSSLLEVAINNEVKLRLKPDGSLLASVSNSSGGSADAIPAFNKANIAYTTAQGAFGSANSLSITIPSAYGHANSAYLNSGVAFGKANAACTAAATAQSTADSAGAIASGAFIGANNAILAIVGVQSNATAAFTQANNALGTAQGAFARANIGSSNSDTIAANNIVVGNSTSNVTITNGRISILGSDLSPVQSFRNKIINGNFDIWQRGTSTSTSGTYCADRFATYMAGSTFTSSQQSFTLGQTSVPGEPTYWHRTVVSSVAGAGNYVIVTQSVESVRTLAGKTATLSFWAKADVSKNIAIEFIQYFGSGGSPSAVVTGIGVTTCALTTSWQKFTVTVAIPSISGKTLGSNNDDYLRIYFWFDGGSTFNSRTNSLGQQSGTFDIAQVQFEESSVATPFEMRPIGMEFSLCQRYFQIGPFNALTFGGNSNVQIFWQFAPLVPFRATPTATLASTTLYWENVAWSEVGSLTSATIDMSHCSNIGGDILIGGTFSPTPSYGSLSLFRASSVSFSAEL